MKNYVSINKKIKNFKSKINVDGDKSLSIRFSILASLAIGNSRANNLLMSEDVISALNCLKKLGVKIKLKKKYCEIIGNGLNSYVYKNNLTLNAGNSGTTARLIASTLISSPKEIKITGDYSLRKRDMKRIIEPLQKFGATFKKNKGTLPLKIKGSDYIRPINYVDNKYASAQTKTAVLICGLFAPGITKLKCLPSRNHTEIIYKKVLKLPIKIKKTRKFDYIELKGKRNFKSLVYNIPGDPSSSAFFVVLTLLSKNSNLIIKNICANPYRIGYITILNKMGAKIKLKNRKIYKGEQVADIHVKSQKYLKSINCPSELNSSAIDEFLVLFLCAAKAKGVSYFSNLEELNKKESKRLNWGSKILNMIGVKNKLTNNSIKIWGQPNLELNKNYQIKNYLKDHRITALSTIIALSLGGNWKIFDSNSINTSFPSFYKIIKILGGKIN